MVCAAMLALGMPVQAEIKAGDVTGGAKAPHVNIAIFHKLHGQDAFAYPVSVAKGDILKGFSGKAQFISMNHTAGLKDNDVITLSNDVLRENAGAFEDLGVDCQVSVHIKNTDVSLAGMCEIFLIDQDHREIEHKGIIKTVTVKNGADWQLIYLGEEDGIAVYANQEIGLE